MSGSCGDGPAQEIEMWTLWIACGGAHEPVAAAPPPAQNPVGTWTSAPCGERTWARTIVFEEGGAYHGTDPVSPCPPGARCIWSGVIEFRGTWAQAEGRVVLTEAPSPPVGPAAAITRPPSLSWRGASLADEAGCVYDRAG
jgi:hypothetical protein